MHDGNPVIDPFCIVDMGLKSGAVLTVRIKDGADRGYTEIKEALAKEDVDEEERNEAEDE